MDVYYPTYHSAAGGGNPNNTYAIDLILTNIDLLALDTNENENEKWEPLRRMIDSEIELGLHYKSGCNGMFNDSGRIMFDETHPGFNPKKDYNIYYGELQEKIKKVKADRANKQAAKMEQITHLEVMLQEMGLEGQHTKQDLIKMLDRSGGNIQDTLSIIMDEMF